ncbi:MAG: hypothetical protein J6X69_02670 [Bacteroidales bacterium]|nr:hypothetical protein [Bacteroidales bacterium]
MLLPLKSSAQTPEDALTIGQNHYGGTARTIAMGNAFTALGGDLGSIAINPAGSAVSGFSQITMTPGINISSSNSRSTNYYNGVRVDQNKAEFVLPNVAFNINFGTGNSILKGFNIGVVSNISNTFTEQSVLGGRTNESSFFGAQAQAATDWRIEAADMEKSDCYDRFPFDLCLNYKAFLYSPITGETNRYVGITENAEGPDAQGNYNITMREGGMLKQNWGREVSGSKNEYFVNLGFNLIDKVFLGASIGLTSFNRRYNDYFKEAAVDPTRYPASFTNSSGVTYHTFWRDGSYNYNISMSGSSFYCKFGVIYVPTPWLRFGAAVQLPGNMQITENYGASANSTFDNAMFSTHVSTGNFQNRYTLRIPMRANFGVAGIIAKRFVLSADYEFCPYGDMVFQYNKVDAEDWLGRNQDIKTGLGTGHSLRFGAEARINSALSARLGYILTNNPSLAGVDSRNHLPVNHFANWGKHGENTFSFGLGFNSKGSFFADVAVAARVFSTGFFYPYDDMHDIDGKRVVVAPEYVIDRTLWTAAVTVGWRF